MFLLYVYVSLKVMKQHYKTVAQIMKSTNQTFAPSYRFLVVLIVAVLLACCFAGCSPSRFGCPKYKVGQEPSGRFRAFNTSDSNSDFTTVASQSL